VIALLQRRNAGADVDHDACAFMPENRRENTLRVGARQRVVVGVAYPGGLDFDQHFTEFRAVQIDGFDAQRDAGFPGNCGFGFHGDRMRRWVVEDL